MKTIRQIADEIGISKQAIYNKIKKEPLSSALQPFISTLDRTLQVDVDGEKLIKSAFNKESQSTQSSKPVDGISQQFIQSLQAQIETLTKQLDVKDEQILKLTDINKHLSESISTDRKNELAGTIIDGQKQFTDSKSKKKGFFGRFKKGE